jgi:colicin import membrane protein
MFAPPMSYSVNATNQSIFGPVAISSIAHIMLVALVVLTPSWNSDPEFIPSVINVQMVELPELGSPPASKPVSPEDSAPLVEQKKAADEPAPSVESAKKPEISVAPPQKISKRALKYKTFKSQKVIENALKRVEKKVDTSPPKPLEDTIKRLREKVSKEGRPAPPVDSTRTRDQVGKGSVYGRGSRKEIELIDLYQLEIAFAINKNWAFADRLSGGANMAIAKLTFKVMPDGSITEVHFTDRSGNQHLDDSAYRAIIKSSPVKPHPQNLSRPYVLVGLRFTPQGVR